MDDFRQQFGRISKKSMPQMEFLLLRSYSHDPSSGLAGIFIAVMCFELRLNFWSCASDWATASSANCPRVRFIENRHLSNCSFRHADISHRLTHIARHVDFQTAPLPLALHTKVSSFSHQRKHCPDRLDSLKRNERDFFPVKTMKSPVCNANSRA